MNTKRQLVILALFTWLGMVTFPILAWLEHTSSNPPGLAEPFNPTNLLLFGIVTGFAVGSMFMPKEQPTMALTAHHGKVNPVITVTTAIPTNHNANAPTAWETPNGQEYRLQVKTHRQAPPHTHPSQAKTCRICQGHGWTEEDIQPRMENRR